MAEAAFKYDFGLEPAWDEICELGLQQNVADLDAYGYTIVPPEIASPDGFIERLLEACLDVSERRNGVRPDLETGYTHADLERTTAKYRFTGHRVSPGWTAGRRVSFAPARGRGVRTGADEPGSARVGDVPAWLQRGDVRYRLLDEGSEQGHARAAMPTTRCRHPSRRSAWGARALSG